jgi:hypothetical protein
MTPAGKALACADAGASLRMTNNNKFVDSCRLLGIYNNKDVYLYSSAKYDRPRLFYISNYFYLPKWVEDHEKLTLLQAIKIINYRMKNNDSDILALEGSPARGENTRLRENLKPEDIKIDATIDMRTSGAGLPASAAQADARSRADDSVKNKK